MVDVATLNAAMEAVEKMRIAEYGEWGLGYDAGIEGAIDAIKSLYPLYPWVIVENGWVCDRYLTEEEARRYLSEYPEGSTVKYQPEEIRGCNLSCEQEDDGSEDYHEVEV